VNALGILKLCNQTAIVSDSSSTHYAGMKHRVEGSAAEL